MKDSKIKVNYIDFILSGLLLLIVASLITIFFSKSAMVDISTKDSFTITVKVSGVSRICRENIRVNDNVYIDESDSPIGRIKTINYHPESMIFKSDTNEDNILLMQSQSFSTSDGSDNYPLTAIIEIECKGTFDGDECEVSGVLIKSKDNLTLNLPQYSTESTVIKINKDNA